jgi:hypothetical protein
MEEECKGKNGGKGTKKERTMEEREGRRERVKRELEAEQKK